MKFKKTVKLYCIPKDYKENKTRLKYIEEDRHQLFINVLKCGAEIIPAIKIVDNLVKITIETKLTQDEILKIMLKSLLFGFYLDIKDY